MEFGPTPTNAREEIKGRIRTIERQIEVAEEEAVSYDQRASRERASADKFKKLLESYKSLLDLSK